MRFKNWKWMTLALATELVFAGAAHAQTTEPPTPIDLQAAYCGAFFRARAESIEADPRAAGLRPLAERDRAMQQRIAGYLLPRIRFIDPTGILTAQRQGQADYAQARAAMEQCLASCPDGPGVWMCSQACDREGHYARLDRCRDAAFLPY
jgi:hypothetical protein